MSDIDDATIAAFDQALEDYGFVGTVEALVEAMEIRRKRFLADRDHSGVRLYDLWISMLRTVAGP